MKHNKDKISVVIPVYNCDKCLEELVSSIIKSITQVTDDYEIIFVNDDSPDNSWEVISKLCQSESNIKGINLSRNFGQHPAIFCGLSYASGDVVVVMDCDLQEDPSYIPELYKKYKEGYDIVFTYRDKRKYPLWKNIGVYFYTLLYNYLVNNKRLINDENVGAFSLISRKVVDSFLQFKDAQFHYIIILRWLGFKSTYVKIKHIPRKHGKSSYNFKKLIDLSLIAIIFQSDKLLKANIYVGFTISFLSFISGLIIVVNYFLHGYAPGWASITLLVLFTLGVLLISIGILGLYIGKMFEQTKQRPVFIVERKINL